MYCITIASKPELRDDLYLILENCCPWGWAESLIDSLLILTAHCPQKAEARRIQRTLHSRHPELSIQIHTEQIQDWSRAWRDFFHPLPLGQKFRIIPAWEQDPWHDPQEIPVFIEPGMAFGTGHHASTQLCLQALAKLQDTGRIGSDSFFLDLGTGSGILGIAAVKMGCCGLALDIDPAAVANAGINRTMNAVADPLLLSAGTLDCLKPGLDFSLILANILSGPLIRMAPAINTRLQPSGILVLSGILQEQEEDVIQAYAGQNIRLEQALHQDEWSGLIFVKEA